jgi:hypothetical protein
MNASLVIFPSGRSAIAVQLSSYTYALSIDDAQSLAFQINKEISKARAFCHCINPDRSYPNGRCSICDCLLLTKDQPTEMKA